MRTTYQRMAADLKIAGYSDSTAQFSLIHGGWLTQNRLLSWKSF